MKRIDLKPSAKQKQKLVAVLLASCILVVAVIWGILNPQPVFGMSPISRIIIPIIGIPFFCWGIFVGIVKLIKGNGYIEISEKGILINVDYAYGFINWSNLEKVDLTNFANINMIGFLLKDVKQYIESKQTLPPKKKSLIRKISAWLMYLISNAMMITSGSRLKAAQINPDVFIKDETVRLEDSFKRFGYHILLSEMFMPMELNDFLITIQKSKYEQVEKLKF